MNRTARAKFRNRIIVTYKYAKDIINAFSYTRQRALVQLSMVILVENIVPRIRSLFIRIFIDWWERETLNQGLYIMNVLVSDTDYLLPVIARKYIF